MLSREDHLYINDTVLFEGVPVIVESITLIENSMLDGIEVPAVPWIASEYFTVTLNNGKWAYGSQIKKEATDGSC